MLSRSGRETDSLFAKQVDVLFDQANVALTANAAAALVVVAIFWNTASHSALLVWLALFALVTIARFYLVHRYKREPVPPEDAHRWFALFLPGVILSGSIWSATVLVLASGASILHIGFAVLWISGLAAGAVAALSIIKSAYFCFAAPALVPCFIYLLSHHDGAFNLVGGAAALFLCFVSMNALRMHKTLLHGLRLQQENTKLIVRLDDEKARVEQLNRGLEQRVKERTRELAVANQHLQEDIVERKQMQKALYTEKERAEVTLHSIGDAVITTDASGTVDYLNPAAEALTGWSLRDAAGQALSTVFRVVNENTREPMFVPIERCLDAGHIATLNEDAVLLSRDGSEYAVQDSVAPIRSYDGTISGIVLVFSDVTDARRMAHELTHQANHDSLTGLLNRRQFEVRLKRVLESTRAQPDSHALCYLDLDQFKIINDTCGHVAGDELLRQLANILLECVRKRDTLARLGGDEFGVLMEHCTLEQGRRVADSLRQAVREFRFSWQEKSFKVGVSIGLVPITEASEGITAVLRAADSACYAAKEAGRDRIHVYIENDEVLARRRGQMQWVNRIQNALEEDHFVLYCQPIVPLSQGSEHKKCYELLLRLQDDTGVAALPKDLLPSAERYDLAVQIDCWVIKNAFDWLTQHPAMMQDTGVCFINISGQSLGDVGFLEFVSDQLDNSTIEPSCICFEITETAMIANLSSGQRFIKLFKARGCQFALDDFGSGLCSFAYLRSLAVDYLKIDGVFVQNMLESGVDLAIVRSINEIGKMMDKKTIAEWVETDTVANHLRELGIDLAQGDGIARPKPIELLLTDPVDETPLRCPEPTG